jgi:hypothetical protein
MPDSPSKEDLFHVALAKPSLEERAAFLDDACAGDVCLRQGLDRLLAAHAQADRFLERPIRSAANLGAFARYSELVTQHESSAQPGGREALGFLSPSSRPDSLGRLGHHHVLEVVGSGGMGIVLRAFDEKLQRVVAIKALAPVLATMGSARQRFVREARGAASVIHENVNAIYAVEDDAPVPYLVMPFVSGLTVQDKIDHHGPLPISEVLRIGMQVASGLAAAHAQGLVHRDIKPDNILLETGTERVKITDFGLARTVDDPSLTQPGLIAGTPAYMSPEQANGDHVDYRSDLFSLGSVLYALCTGRAPFAGTTMVAVLKRVCEQVPGPVSDVNPDIPDWLEALIAKLHAKDPAGRPQTAAEVADLLGWHLGELEQRNRGSIPAAATAGKSASGPSPPARGIWDRSLPAIAAIVLLTAGLSTTEATGVTNFRGIVIHLFAPGDTLIAEVDNPAVSVSIEDVDLVITGVGVPETRLKTGAHKVRARKDGKLVPQKLVSIHRDGREVVRISKEATPLSDADIWEESVTRLPAEKQVEAVATRLKQLNPGFDGTLIPTLENGAVTRLKVLTLMIENLSPVRALRELRSLECAGHAPFLAKLSDLTPLRGLRLEKLDVNHSLVTDLGPLQGMPLTKLHCGWTGVADLSPLKDMKLQYFTAQMTRVSELSELHEMPLIWLDLCDARKISDLRALKGMPLHYLNVSRLSVSDLSVIAGLKTLRRLVLDDLPVSDLTPLKGLELSELSILGTRATDLSAVGGMPLKQLRLDYQSDRKGFVRSFADLERINDIPASQFWKTLDASKPAGSLHAR